MRILTKSSHELMVRGAHAIALRTTLLIALLVALVFYMGRAIPAEDGPPIDGRRAMSLDAFSIVKVKTRAVSNARSRATLGPERIGTGVVIDSSGLVLTIGYLIQEAESVEVLAADGRAVPANVVAFDDATGFGLLRTAGALSVPPIAFGESGQLGGAPEPVLIVGYDGVAPAFVVSRRPFVGYWEYLLDDAIYTAPVTVNWQGAALINKQGQLLGVGSLAVPDAVGGRTQIPGNMFVPIDLLKPILGDLIVQGRATAKPRPWLGISTQELSGKLMVTRVSPESPADDAGLVPGDIIVGIHGRPLQGQADFYRKMWAGGDAGSEVMLDVLQGIEIKKLGVKSIDRDTYYRAKPVY